MTSVEFQQCPTCFEVYDRGDIVLRYHHRDEKLCRICYQTYRTTESHSHNTPKIEEITNENLPFHWSEKECLNFLDNQKTLPDWWSEFEKFLQRRKHYLEEEKEYSLPDSNKVSDFSSFFKNLYQEKVKSFCDRIGIEYTPPVENITEIDLTEINLSDSDGDQSTSKKITLKCQMVSFQKNQQQHFQVEISSLASVCLLKIKINKQQKLGGWGFIRLIQRGKELKNDQILESLELNLEIPIFVVYRNPQQNQSPSPQVTVTDVPINQNEIMKDDDDIL